MQKLPVSTFIGCRAAFFPLSPSSFLFSILKLRSYDWRAAEARRTQQREQLYRRLISANRWDVSPLFSCFPSSELTLFQNHRIIVILFLSDNFCENQLGGWEMSNHQCGPRIFQLSSSGTVKSKTCFDVAKNEKRIALFRLLWKLQNCKRLTSNCQISELSRLQVFNQVFAEKFAKTEKFWNSFREFTFQMTWQIKAFAEGFDIFRTALVFERATLYTVARRESWISLSMITCHCSKFTESHLHSPRIFRFAITSDARLKFSRSAENQYTLFIINRDFCYYFQDVRNNFFLPVLGSETIQNTHLYFQSGTRSKF